MQEWRVVQRNRGSTLKQLWARLRTGIWVPTERFMFDGQVMPPVMGGAPGTVGKQVAATGDDGYRVSGSLDFVSNAVLIRAGYVDSTFWYNAHFFARWTGVSIEGTIDVSYIECYGYENGVGSATLKVYGVDEDNPAAPTSGAEFDADPPTDAAVDWDGAWTINVWEQSPSLNSIFQELVDTYAIANEAVMVQVKNDGGTGNNYNTARSYDYTGNAHGPKLHIEWSEAAAGVPKQMMHYMRMRKE